MRRRWSLLALASLAGAVAAPVSAEGRVVRSLDLSSAYHLPPGASLIATQGPTARDSLNEPAPGAIRICIRRSADAPCSPNLARSFVDAHYVETAELVRLGSSAPLIHLQLASLHAVNGAQGHFAAVFAYRPSERRFETIFEHVVGGNMNQEIRLVRTGPLKGAMIVTDPTNDRPFGYWMTVYRLILGQRYRQALRYRSATRYGDGNSLAVIDSEMPNILARLGMWSAGRPLPLPAKGCARPRLVKMELWCS